MTTTDTPTSQLIINRLTKTQFEGAIPSNTELWAVDPEFVGNKLLATDANGDIIESNITPVSRTVGEVVEFMIPPTSTTLLRLDGSLLSGSGTYADFVDYVADLYNDDPTADYFAQPNQLFDWVQPVLTANGTMGGDSFAVSSDIPQLTEDGNDVWRAFDGSHTNNYFFHSTYNNTVGNIDMYNPIPLIVTNFKIYNQGNENGRASTSGTIYGSNDGSTWTQITTYTNSVTNAGESWNIDLSSNTTAYKYYRMHSNGGPSWGYWVIYEIEITAKSFTQTAEETWQAIKIETGECDKFVYDTNANTVRIPYLKGYKYMATE